MPKRLKGRQREIRIILWSLIGVGVLLGPFSIADGKEDAQRNFKDCLSCHQGIEEISPNHKMECMACHLGPERRSQKILASHHEIIRNPSDPSTFKDFCLPCHERQIKNLEASLHSTMAGIINQTRYLWGAQGQASPGIYALSGPFQRLPEPDETVTPDSPERLVDDFLRRRCLRCHIHVKGFPAAGLYRASGCAACHVLYSNDGQYRGKDKAIQRGSKGYPTRHAFMKTIPNEQCLHCHHQNHVGADYEGLFEKDYSATYRAPRREGRPPVMIYGQTYHHLAKDIHAEKGLWCIDCHRNIMGDGTAHSYSMEVPKTACADCHGGYDKDLPNLGVDGIIEA